MDLPLDLMKSNEWNSQNMRLESSLIICVCPHFLLTESVQQQKEMHFQHLPINHIHSTNTSSTFLNKLFALILSELTLFVETILPILRPICLIQFISAYFSLILKRLPLSTRPPRLCLFERFEAFTCL